MEISPQNSMSISQLVKEINPHGKFVRVWSLGGGISAEMTAFEVIVDGTMQKYILRLPGWRTLEGNPDAAENEFKNLRLTQALGLPAPKPLFLDKSRQIFDRDYLIVEYIEGEPLFSLTDPDDMLRQMAEMLASIHQADYSSFDISYLPNFSDLGCADDQPPSSLLSTTDLDGIRVAMKKAAPTHQNPIVLLHCDYWPGNLLWQNGKLTAVIDWEDACLGDPLVDFAGCRLDLAWIIGVDAFTIFSQHYLAQNPINTTDLPFYDLCVALRLARLIGNDLEGWAAFFLPYGRKDITPETIRMNFHYFVQQAIEKISE